MLEHTEVKGNLLYVLKPVAPGRNVSQRGEDVQRGKIIIKSGTRLRPQEIGMLAQLKKLRVRVYPRPTVAMIVTGDELVSPWSTENKSIDTNSYMLGSALREVGGVLGFVKRVVDDERKIIRAIHKALNYDVVVITGGTSVGRRDFVPNCLRRLGKLIFHGVAVRPASPTAFGLIKGTPVFCLPGFPVAAFLAFHLFVKPALLKLQGLSPLHSKETVRAVLTTDVTSTLGRTDILRVKLRRAGGRFLAEPLRITGSGVLSSLVNADGIVLIPENIEGLAKGESVEVELI
jgi:molybdopterin molybdotransferase